MVSSNRNTQRSVQRCPFNSVPRVANVGIANIYQFMAWRFPDKINKVCPGGATTNIHQPRNRWGNRDKEWIANKCHEEFTTHIYIYLTTTLPFKSPIPSIFSNWSLRLSDSVIHVIPSVWGQEIHLLFSNGARKDGTVGPVSGTPNNVAIQLELAEELKDAPPFGGVWAWCEEWASHFWLIFVQRGWTTN